MNLSQIITLADGYVPNNYTNQQKADWLTEINKHFFEVVKIPKVFPFNAFKDIADYTLTGMIALRNIDRVIIGTAKYDSLQLSDVPPGQNGWTFDETTNKLSLQPAPTYDTPGYMRYAQRASVVFDPAAFSTTYPEAPDAYHEAYAYGLAETMANALDDTIRAANYGAKYNAELTIAQANYQRGG